MKILMAHNFLYQRGGAEKVFLEDVECLRAIGHEVVPFSRKHPRNITTGFEDYYPPPMDWSSGSFLEKAGTAANIVYSRDVYRRFKRLILDFKPDIVHFHNIFTWLTTALVDAAKEQKIPMVMTLHDYKQICPSYFMLSKGRICERCEGHKYYHAVLQGCHKGSRLYSAIYAAETSFNVLFRKYEPIRYFLCPSHFLLSKHRWRIPEEKLLYLPYALYLDKYEFQTRDQGYVLFAGRLSPEKGVVTLLEAIRDLGHPVVFAGEGPLEPVLKEKLGKPGWEHVRWVGYQGGEALAGYFRGARLVVVPSEWYENAPLSILESFAYGKPVIGARLGGMEELIGEGERGLLFQAGNAAELRESILKLMADQGEVSRMGRNARRMVEERFNMANHGQELEAIYRKTLGALEPKAFQP